MVGVQLRGDVVPATPQPPSLSLDICPYLKTFSVLTTEGGAGALGIEWVEARDAADLWTIHGTVCPFPTRSYPAPKVNAKVEKP